MVAVVGVSAHLSPPQPPLLLVLLGPTASGKTALSLELAERWDGEIVSCDSVAVYRELEIGTAKPTLEQRARVPHHCIDIASPASDYSAGDYQRDARAAVAAISAAGRIPIVTGGTGLYLRALLRGLFVGPRRSEAVRQRLRRSVARHGEAWLSRLLRRLDPKTAARIHANDTPKLIRAIEVSLQGRMPMSQAWQGGTQALTGYRVVRIGLAPERPLLYQRINARAQQMFLQGLVAETDSLIARYGAESRIFDTLGYRQAKQVLAGGLTEQQAVAAAQQGHRNYAKRQFTWFRREPEVHWLRGFGDDPAIQREAIAAVAGQSFLLR